MTTGCPRRDGRRRGRGIDALQQVQRLVVQGRCVEEARKGWCGTREGDIRRGGRWARWSWWLSIRERQVHWMIGIHRGQVTSTAESYAAPDCNGVPIHHTTPQLQEVITGNCATALNLITTTANNSITAIVGILWTKKEINVILNWFLIRCFYFFFTSLWSSRKFLFASLFLRKSSASEGLLSSVEQSPTC